MQNTKQYTSCTKLYTIPLHTFKTQNPNTKNIKIKKYVVILIILKEKKPPERLMQRGNSGYLAYLRNVIE